MGIRENVAVAVLSVLCVFVKGQNEVCKFYGLEAQCRYRIDGICLSAITATIDQCTDPLQVKFTVSCERNPVVRFSHTFTGEDSIVTVRGFYQDVSLRVRLRMKKSDLLNVEADFIVYNLPDTDFINDDVKLRALEEVCGSLNEAGKIAIGVMAGLFVIAGILLIVLLWIRRQRNIQKANQSRTVLVNEQERTDPNPSRLSTIEETGFEEDSNVQNTTQNNGISRMSREVIHTDHHRSGELNQSTVHSNGMSRERAHADQNRTREANQINMQSIRSDRDRVDNSEPSVRYSDVLRHETTGSITV